MTNDQDQSAPNVAVIRQHDGPDIIGIILGCKMEGEGIHSRVSCYLIEHPVVPIIDYSDGSYNMMPWSPFTEQTIFEFSAKDMVFMTPAKKNVTSIYLNGLAMKNVVTGVDSEQTKKEKIAFRTALESLTLSPGTETLQ